MVLNTVAIPRNIVQRVERDFDAWQIPAGNQRIANLRVGLFLNLELLKTKARRSNFDALCRVGSIRSAQTDVKLYRTINGGA